MPSILLASLIGLGNGSVEAGAVVAAREVAADLVSVASCPQADRNRSVRIVVFNRGFEHVSSEVYVEWLEWRDDGPHLVGSALVAELSSGTWSVASPSVVSAQRCAMQVRATHTYSAQSARFVIQPISVGTYSIRSGASGQGRQ